MCHHAPHCPEASDRRHCCEAHVVADHSEQGWYKLCNGVILFDDGAFLTPAGECLAVPRHAAA